MKNKIIYSFLIILSLFIITGCENNNGKYDAMKGTWKASIENQNFYQNTDNEIVGGKEDYYLKCDGKGFYDLTAKSGDLANARYSISNKTVTFYDEANIVLSVCKLNKKELDCSEKGYYAFKYIKIK